MTKWIVILVVLIGLQASLMLLFEGAPDADIRYSISSAHEYIDPQMTSWNHDFRIVNCLYERLVMISVPDLKVEPGVAERYEISDDKLTYTFHLRENAKWSNGDPVTAHDFVYAWRRAMLPDLAAAYTFLMFYIKGGREFFDWRTQALKGYVKGDDKSRQAAEALWKKTLQKFDELVGLKAGNDRTLVVTLEDPAPYFIEICAFGTYAPVHRQTVEKMVHFDIESGMIFQDPTWTSPKTHITNGPYVLKKRKTKRFLYMEANPHYWNATQVRNKSILEKFIVGHDQAELAFSKGELNWLPLPTTIPMAADLIAESRAGKRNDVQTSTSNGTYYLRFNCRKQLPGGRPNPFANPLIRRAFSMAIDRQSIVEQVTRLHQPVATTFVPPGVIPDYTPPADVGVRFDPKGARELLAKAGHPGGEGLGAIELIYNTGSGHEGFMLTVRSQWEKYLGVKVTIRGVETRILRVRTKNGEFMAARAGWLGDYRDATTFLQLFHSEDGHNEGKYNNPVYDKLLATAAKELDYDKRIKILQQAERVMIQEQAIAPIYHYTNLELWRPGELDGLHLNAWNRVRLEQVKVNRSYKTASK